LHQQVAAMNLDNFVVRTKRQTVEKYAQQDIWQNLEIDDVNELAQNIANLPTELTDDDEEAKRFDLLMFRTQLAVLQAKKDFKILRGKIQAIASALESQEAIPAIKAQMLLIQEITSDEWWQDVTVTMLESARKKLRGLVKLIEKTQKKIVYTNFEDELGDFAVIDLPQVSSSMNLAKFKDKARLFLRTHENHLSLQRLRRNQALTASDISELERMLFEAGGSQELIDQAIEQNEGLGVFIRSLVGLERDAATQAFSEFVSDTTLKANQIEFISEIVEHLVQEGVMKAERLYESPFTDINALGAIALFPTAKVNRISEILDDIRLKAFG
jgi:type I restriction enzyme R subunit